MYKSLKLLLAASAIATLAACGGGGDSTGPAPGPVAAPVTTTFPIKAAYTNLVRNSSSLQFSLSGSLSGISVSGGGTITRGTLVSSTFEGVPALRQIATLTGTVAAGANTAPLAAVISTFVDTNYNPLGSSADGNYAVISGTVNIPTTAVINDTGILYTANTFTASNKSVRTGTNAVSYALQPDTSTTGLLKVISVQKNVAGATTLTSTLTLRIDASGAITYLNESTAFSNGDSLTLTY